MENNAINFKAEKAKINAKRKMRDVYTWIDNNKEIIMIAAPTVIGMIKWGAKQTSKSVDNRRERELKTLYKWDPSAGCYYHLRRALTNDELRRIDKRVHENKERMGDILDEMKVLK